MSDWDKKWKNSTKPASAFREHKDSFDSWREFLVEQDAYEDRYRLDPYENFPSEFELADMHAAAMGDEGWSPEFYTDPMGRKYLVANYQTTDEETGEVYNSRGIDYDGDGIADAVHPEDAIGGEEGSLLGPAGFTWAQQSAKSSWDLPPEQSTEVDILNQNLRASQLNAIGVYRDSYALRDDGDHGSGAHAWIRYIQERLLPGTSIEATEENAIEYYSNHILPQVDAVLSEDRVFAAQHRDAVGGVAGVHHAQTGTFERDPQTQSGIHMDVQHLQDNLGSFGTLDDVMGHELGHSLGYMINPYVGMGDVEVSMRWAFDKMGMMDEYEEERANMVESHGEELTAELYDTPGVMGTFNNFGIEGRRANLADNPIFRRSMHKIQDERMSQLYGEEDESTHHGHRAEQLGGSYWKRAQLNQRYREEQQLPPEERTVTTNRFSAEQVAGMRAADRSNAMDVVYDDVEVTADTPPPAEPEEEQAPGLGQRIRRFFTRDAASDTSDSDAEEVAERPDLGPRIGVEQRRYPSVLDWEEHREPGSEEGHRIHTFQTSDVEGALQDYAPSQEELSDEEAADIMNSIALANPSHLSLNIRRLRLELHLLLPNTGYTTSPPAPSANTKAPLILGGIF